MPFTSQGHCCNSLEDGETLTLFGSTAMARRYIEVEVALSQAQAHAGIIPKPEADSIRVKSRDFSPDIERLHQAIVRDGFPIIDLVEQFRDHVGDKDAHWVHWGATTQDIMDTAFVLQLREVTKHADGLLQSIMQSLAQLAKEHRHTAAIGRTHLQPALPIPLGLRFVNWLVPLGRHRRRLEELRGRTFTTQCGGAAGTLASYGNRGTTVVTAFARILGLETPLMPWHTQRDSLTELAYWTGGVHSSLAKIALDILHLSQSEIGELHESRDRGKGRSSAMPHKRNSVVCEGILARRHAAAAHVHALASAPPPEQERGTQTVQLEHLHFPVLCALTIAALKAIREVIQGLHVDVYRVTANLEKTHGILLAEALALALSGHMNSVDARELVRKACETALEEKRHVVDILSQRTKIRIDLNQLRNDQKHFGSAQIFIEQALEDAFRATSSSPQQLKSHE